MSAGRAGVSGGSDDSILDRAPGPFFLMPGDVPSRWIIILGIASGLGQQQQQQWQEWTTV